MLKGIFSLRLLLLALCIILISVGCNKKLKTLSQDPGKNPVNKIEQHIPPPTEESPLRIRKPAVAGTFYPAEAADLEKMVKLFLSKADKSKTRLSGSILEILVPHAGFVFSGQTAACCYAALEGIRYDTIILIGPPHRVPVSGGSVYCGDAFETPLGLVPVDTELANALARSSSLINRDETPHIQEHSLEVQLPFLQIVLGDFSIVPLLVMGDKESLDQIAQVLSSVVFSQREKNTLFVISTDLAHFPKKQDAVASDRAILEAFASLDGEKLLAADREIMQRGIPNLVCTMCGIDAAYIGQKIAGGFRTSKAVILHTSVSSDTDMVQTSPERVVGYGAVAVTVSEEELKQRNSRIIEKLNKKEQEYLLAIARKALEEYTRTKKMPILQGITGEGLEHLYRQSGVFVTLYKNGQLRGCIGNHQSSFPLWQTVGLLAVSSGFSDPRFPPLRQEELGDITIEISVYLSRIEPIKSIDEFEIGKHGIILQKGNRSATFLPQVALEQGWDKETTLDNLCLKAGLPPGAWKDKNAILEIYRTQVFHE